MSEQNYDIKNLLTFGEVRKIRSNMSSFVELSERFKDKKIDDLSNDDFLEISKIMVKNDESDQMVAGALARCYDLTQDQLNEFSYQKAIELFSKLFNESTVIKKKSGQQYA